jgi:hypothetical protein
MLLPFTHLDVSLFLPAAQAIVSSHLKNLSAFLQDSVNKVSRILWLAKKSSEFLGPVIANCQYCNAALL